MLRGLLLPLVGWAAVVVSEGVLPIDPHSDRKSTTDSDPGTPAPPAVVPTDGASVWCLSDRDCRIHGDPNATCSVNACNCSRGYSTPGYSAQRVAMCVSRESLEWRRVPVVVAFVFPGAVCQTIDTEHFDALVDAVARTVGKSYLSARLSYSCGSAVSVFGTAVADAEKANKFVTGTLSFARSLSGRVAGLGLGNVTEARLSSGRECETADARESVRDHLKRCHAVTCNGVCRREMSGGVYACDCSSLRESMTKYLIVGCLLGFCFVLTSCLSEPVVWWRGSASGTCAHADANDKNDWTLLHAAAHYGRAGDIEVLVHKADVHAAVGERLRTALHVAVLSPFQNPDVLRCLLKHSANPDQLDADGKTALDLAAVGQNAARNVLRPVTLWTLQPSHFERQAEVCALARLAEGSEEWAMVCRRVCGTMPKARVRRVDRVQNKRLLENYESGKRKMFSRSKERRLLFHGTSGTAPCNIFDGEFGFDMRFSSVGMWGKALYFAENCSYSNGYKFVDPVSGHFQIFLAEVCIGDYTTLASDRNLTHAPPSPYDFGKDAPRNLQYNAVKGHTNGSDVFMVYSNSQAYPKYLITYSPS